MLGTSNRVWHKKPARKSYIEVLLKKVCFRKCETKLYSRMRYIFYIIIFVGSFCLKLRVLNAYLLQHTSLGLIVYFLQKPYPATKNVFLCCNCFTELQELNSSTNTCKFTYLVTYIKV